MELKPGDIETFQYDSPTLGVVQYALAVVSVNGNTGAPTASVRHAARLAADAGAAILNAAPIHGFAVPLPLAPAPFSNLTLNRGVLAPALELARAPR